MVNVLSALCGEIDRVTANAFRDDVCKTIDQCDVSLVRVDLQAVTFIDSAGYHALVAADDYATRRGRIMSIRNLSAQCARVIGICNVDNDLHIEGFASVFN